MNDRVTWLIPILNGMPYLPETLASIEAQTYTNWEVLVWDNGSTDGTLEELQKWIPARLPGRIFTGEPHGVGGSLKRLVEECKTELCARIDADDINFLERLEIQVSFLDANPEIAILGSQMKYIDGKGNVQEPIYHVPLEHNDIVHGLLKSNCIGHPSIIFRRSAVLQVGNYRDVKNVEDYDLWLRLAAQFKFANLEQPLVYYRVHHYGTTQVAIRENRIRDLTDNCFNENASILFGCTQDEAKLLRKKSHPFAIQPLLKISKYLQKNQGGDLLSRIRSKSFVKSSNSLLGATDIFSRLAIIAITLDKLESHSEVLDIIKTLFQKIPGLQSTVKKIKLWKWLNAQKKFKSNIHQSIKILGISPPFDLIEISENCKIQQNSTIEFVEFQWWEHPKLTVKANVRIGCNTYISIKQPIIIGKGVIVGDYAYITSTNHDHSKRELPVGAQALIDAPVNIEDKVCIESYVTVLPGVTIGEGAIISAGSVVVNNIPAYEVWAGIPAKFVKTLLDKVN
jgi:acetyltransferase-like isoleucine patch superfamily enzyme